MQGVMAFFGKLSRNLGLLPKQTVYFRQFIKTLEIVFDQWIIKSFPRIPDKITWFTITTPFYSSEKKWITFYFIFFKLDVISNCSKCGLTARIWITSFYDELPNSGTFFLFLSALDFTPSTGDQRVPFYNDGFCNVVLAIILLLLGFRFSSFKAKQH